MVDPMISQKPVTQKPEEMKKLFILIADLMVFGNYFSQKTPQKKQQTCHEENLRENAAISDPEQHSPDKVFILQSIFLFFFTGKVVTF